MRHPLAEVTAWLREPILKAPLEVTVVGDVSLAATVRAVAAALVIVSILFRKAKGGDDNLMG